MPDQDHLIQKVFDQWAHVYQDKYMDVSDYAPWLDAFCDAITTQNARILDVACGPGNNARYLLDKRPDFKLLGIDLAPEMIQLARVNNPAARFELMNIGEIETLDSGYDGIICGFCLPYLSKEGVKKLLSDAEQLLKQEGLLYISTMEDEYSKSGLQGPSNGEGPKIYMHYYLEADLRSMLDTAGFKLMQVGRVKSQPNTVDIVILAKKSKHEADKTSHLKKNKT